jgi:periplasmic protein TonB
MEMIFSPTLSPTLSKDKLWGMSLAVAAHILLFAGGSIGLLQKVDYGVDPSDGLAAVDLIAAPETAPVPQVAPPPPIEDQEAVPDPAKTQPAPETPPPPVNAAPTPQKSAASGALALAGYYRNPPPRYPEEARKLQQQGRVLLEVGVTAEGRVSSVKLKESSGFPLLDQAALEGVQNWRFRAARMAGLRMDTVVDVPIRFQLK